jgi:hypothetical protein
MTGYVARMPRTARVIGILVAIWIVAGAVVWTIRTNRPTPEKIQNYLATHPLNETSGTQRAAEIGKIADRLNRLDFEQRQKLQRTTEMRAFYRSLTDAERSDFLDRTLPEGFRQVMLALNKMTPEKRSEIVERALRNIEKGRSEGEDAPSPVNDAMMKKIVSQGMMSFYEEANADVKLDFAPVIEQIQQSLRWRN